MHQSIECKWNIYIVISWLEYISLFLKRNTIKQIYVRSLTSDLASSNTISNPSYYIYLPSYADLNMKMTAFDRRWYSPWFLYPDQLHGMTPSQTWNAGSTRFGRQLYWEQWREGSEGVATRLLTSSGDCQASDFCLVLISAWLALLI